METPSEIMNEFSEVTVYRKRYGFDTTSYQSCDIPRKRIKCTFLNKSCDWFAPLEISEDKGNQRVEYFDSENCLDDEEESHDFISGRELRKLLLYNLDVGIVDYDIVNLFGKFGQLQSSEVHYDTSGRCKGTAEVIFRTRSDAMKAMDYYNEKLFSGRPIGIQICFNNNANKRNSASRSIRRIGNSKLVPLFRTHLDDLGRTKLYNKYRWLCAKDFVTSQQLDGIVDCYVNAG